MKYTITIDDETQAGAGLLEVAKSISKKDKSVTITKGITEDEWLASEIKKSKKLRREITKEVTEKVLKILQQKNER
jgi:hypothetical protein